MVSGTEGSNGRCIIVLSLYSKQTSRFAYKNLTKNNVFAQVRFRKIGNSHNQESTMWAEDFTRHFSCTKTNWVWFQPNKHWNEWKLCAVTFFRITQRLLKGANRIEATNWNRNLERASVGKNMRGTRQLSPRGSEKATKNKTFTQVTDRSFYQCWRGRCRVL